MIDEKSNLKLEKHLEELKEEVKKLASKNEKTQTMIFLATVVLFGFIYGFSFEFNSMEAEAFNNLDDKPSLKSLKNFFGSLSKTGWLKVISFLIAAFAIVKLTKLTPTRTYSSYDEE